MSLTHNITESELKNILNEATRSYKVIVVDFFITDSSGAVLVQKRSPNRTHFPSMWEVPGGKLHAGESIEECIRREMHEECSMQLKEIVALIHKFEWDSYKDTLNLQFLVRASGDFKPEEGKVTEHRWVAKDEVYSIFQETERNQIFKGLYYAFGYLEGLKTKLHPYNFDYQTFFTDLVGRFYEFTSTDLPIPKVTVSNLADGQNIKSDIKKNTLEIDIKLLTKTNVFFSSIVILHDLYHNLKQGIRAYHDVVTIRDVFGQDKMLMFDIDADIEIYKFLEREYDFDFHKYIETLWEGSTVFRDTVARMPKVQRFMGSIMSIYALSKNQRVILFPSLTKIHDALFVVSQGPDGFFFHQLPTKDIDLESAISAFRNVNNLSKQAFTSTLQTFCEHFVGQITESNQLKYV